MSSKVLAFLALLFCCNSLRADLIIEVKDAHVVVDSVGYVEVQIYSTDSDNLSIFGYDFRITTNAVNSKLTFQGVQEFTASDIDDYIFPSDASAYNVLLEEDWISGGDGLPLDGDGNQQSVSVGQGQENAKTLVRLMVKHELIDVPADEALGDEFTISLWDEGSTVFSDSGYNLIDLDPLSTPASFGFAGGALSSGKITIVATPEPATWLLLSSAVATFWGSRRLRTKRSSSSVRN